MLQMPSIYFCCFHDCHNKLLHHHACVICFSHFVHSIFMYVAICICIHHVHDCLLACEVCFIIICIMHSSPYDCCACFLLLVHVHCEIHLVTLFALCMCWYSYHLFPLSTYQCTIFSSFLLLSFIVASDIFSSINVQYFPINIRPCPKPLCPNSWYIKLIWLG